MKGSPRLFAWAALFGPLTLGAIVAVQAVPRARGIAFPLPLRLSVLVPTSAALALLATWAYPKMPKPRPRRAFAAYAGGVGVALWLVSWMGGGELAAAAGVSVLTVVALAVWLAPRFVERPPRRAGTIAWLVLAAFEIAVAALALATERAPASEGLAFEVPRRLFDVDHHYLEIEGARVHYVDEGRGPTLLFLHGNPAWSFQWRELIAGLRDSFRCVALDYPGFGLSQAAPGYGFTPREQSAVVETLVDRLDLHDITLVMQDWGGPIGLGFAVRRPERVRAVVLGNTWAWPTTTSEARGKFSKIVGGPLGELVQVNSNALPAMALERGVMHPLPQEVVDLYVRPFAPLERRGIAIFYPAQITDANPYLAEVEAGLSRLESRPALFFWGLRDPGMPRVDLERFEGAFPQHQTFELDADHFFFEDVAPQMIDEIRRFVPTVVAGAQAP